MGQSINTGLVQADLTANITTTLPVPGTSQTLINRYLEIPAADTDIYTVPAGKIFYLYGFQHTSASSTLTIGIDDTTLGSGRFMQLVAAATDTSPSVISNSPINLFAAGEKVTMKGSGQMVTMWGVLVDA